MTGSIFKDWVTAFNRRMSADGRHGLLLLDNAPSHPQELKLSHVTLKFLPANTTSVLQPLDLGIIKNIKCQYHTRLLRGVLSKLETATSASQVARSVNCLDACHWVKDSVLAVKPSTAQRCFQKAGVQPQLDSVDADPEDHVPLARLLDTTVDRLQLPEPVTVEDYAELDRDIPATEQLVPGWEQTLFTDVTSQGLPDAQQAGNDDDELGEVEDSPAAITSLSDAIRPWARPLKKAFSFLKSGGNFILLFLTQTEGAESKSGFPHTVRLHVKGQTAAILDFKVTS